MGDRQWRQVKAVVAELQANPPDVICRQHSQTVAALLRRRLRTLVFAANLRTVAQGFVQSLAHPGGNATGFTAMEASIGPNGCNFSRRWPSLAVSLYVHTNNPVRYSPILPRRRRARPSRYCRFGRTS